MEDDLSAEEAQTLLDRLMPQWQFAVGSASSEKFLRGAWALHAMQSDNISMSSDQLVNAPSEAHTTDITSEFKVHQWELETIINEHLVYRHDGLYRSFAPSDWNHWSHLVNLLRQIENAEAGVHGSPERIIDHLFHIGSRQFEWQAGFLNNSELFRGIFVYGQGECATAFERKFGLSIQSLFAYGFGLMAMFMQSPYCRADLNFATVGLTPEEVSAASKILTSDVDELSEIARNERDSKNEIAFRPSALRLVPCIRTGFRNKYLFCPLPELIMKRISTGIFYDIADGGHIVREDYGRRFEDYVALLIETYQPDFVLGRELKYKTKLGEARTPDIFLGRKDESVDLVIECKATRMSFETRYSDIGVLGPQKYDEMIKAVFQIWRHALHSRTGKTSPRLKNDAVGLVLTFDDWFQGGVKREELVVSEAAKLFHTKFAEASELDRIPVAFASMTEFEFLLQTGNPQSIIDTLHQAAAAEKRGWSVTSLHGDNRSKEAKVAKFPFESQLAEILPLWGKIKSRADERYQRDN